MKNTTIFILLYNNSVQYASKDVKSLVGALQTMCQRLTIPVGLSYVQITRIINEHLVYTHNASLGHSFQIISRQLLYTRRKKKNGNTTPEEVVNSQSQNNSQ